MSTRAWSFERLLRASVNSQSENAMPDKTADENEYLHM